MSVSLSGPFDTSKLPRIAADPVTVTVARTVAPGFEAEFQRWADELVAAARVAPGYLGAGVFHPGYAGGEYQIVVRFIDGIHLREWERSAVRNELMERGELFVTGARVQRTVGVDEWFEAAANARPHGPAWRRVFSDVAWVYPVSFVLAWLVAPWYGSLPLPARVLIGATLVTVVLQGIVSPTRRRLRRLRRL
jgi:hypothetical protein